MRSRRGDLTERPGWPALRAAAAPARALAAAIAHLFEGREFSSRKTKAYTAALLALFVLLIGLRVAGFPGRVSGVKVLTDFDCFHIVGGMVRAGQAAAAYSWRTLQPMQQALSGTSSFMPWTYPPQFDLLVAGLSFLPRPAAYGLFTAATLAAYLAVLKRLAPDGFLTLLLVLFPMICLNIGCGQNGFLTGALIGLACMGLERRRALAGLPLGLMVIKPHLAVAFAAYTLFSRRWATAAVAGLVVAATSVLATMALGPAVWPALLGGLKEAQLFLEGGYYPLFRMVSPYAALRSFGAPALAAMAVQVLAAVLALGLACWPRPGRTVRQSLGLTAIASLLISPYAYDYDLSICGIGLALLLPDLVRLGRPSERFMVYGLSLFMSAYGLVQTTRIDREQTALIVHWPPTAAGLALVALLLLAWRIVARDRQDRAAAAVTDALPFADLPVAEPAGAA